MKQKTQTTAKTGRSSFSLVDLATHRKPIDFAKAVESILQKKASAAVNSIRTSVANNMFGIKK
jgi:hypothetical protein